MVPWLSTGCQWLLEKALLVLPQEEMELGRKKKVYLRTNPERMKGGDRTLMLHSQAQR